MISVTLRLCLCFLQQCSQMFDQQRIPHWPSSDTLQCKHFVDLLHKTDKKEGKLNLQADEAYKLYEGNSWYSRCHGQGKSQLSAEAGETAFLYQAVSMLFTSALTMHSCLGPVQCNRHARNNCRAHQCLRCLTASSTPHTIAPRLTVTSSRHPPPTPTFHAYIVLFKKEYGRLACSAIQTVFEVGYPILVLELTLLVSALNAQ